MTPLPVGAKAPDFSLTDQHGQTISLSDYRGRAVLLVFYPHAFTGVCGGELSSIRDNLEKFDAEDRAVLAISTDPVPAIRAMADADGLFFPLLSDFWPHGEVASAYGIFDDAGQAKRSSFVVDPDGLISWTLHNDYGEQRDVDEQAAALATAAAI